MSSHGTNVGCRHLAESAYDLWIEADQSTGRLRIVDAIEWAIKKESVELESAISQAAELRRALESVRDWMRLFNTVDEHLDAVRGIIDAALSSSSNLGPTVGCDSRRTTRGACPDRTA